MLGLGEEDDEVTQKLFPDYPSSLRFRSLFHISQQPKLCSGDEMSERSTRTQCGRCNFRTVYATNKTTSTCKRMGYTAEVSDSSIFFFF